MLSIRSENAWQVEAGYFTTAADPLVTFKCVNTLDCPGGTPGTCGGALEGVPCGDCPQGTFYAGEAACEQCSAGAVIAWIVSLGLVLLGLIWAYHFLNSPITAKASTLFSTTCAIGMMINLLQNLGIIGTMSVLWQNAMLLFVVACVVPVGKAYRLGLRRIGKETVQTRPRLSNIEFCNPFDLSVLFDKLAPKTAICASLPGALACEFGRLLQLHGSLHLRHRWPGFRLHQWRAAGVALHLHGVLLPCGHPVVGLLRCSEPMHSQAAKLGPRHATAHSSWVDHDRRFQGGLKRTLAGHLEKAWHML